MTSSSSERKRCLKILFVIDSLGAGGAERSLQELLPWLTEARITPIVACFRRRNDGVEDNVLGRIDIRSLEGLSRPAQMRALRRIAVNERVDLVHVTLFEASVFGRPAFAGTGIPVLTSLVTTPFDDSKLRHDPHLDAKRVALVRLLEATSGWLFSDHFHAITAAVKDAAASKLFIPPDRISVVHRGRDGVRLGRRTPERRRKVRDALALSEDDFVFLVAARGDVPKGVSIALAAFGEIHAKLPNAVLVWAGRDGNAGKAISAALRDLPASARVMRLGHRNDVPDLMTAADIYVLPSLWEGLGCVVLEAMALELPVVASDLPAVREVVGPDGAEFAPPADFKALGSAMLSLALSAPQRSKLAERGRVTFERSFTLERSARKMLELFEHVAGRAQARRAPG